MLLKSDLYSIENEYDAGGIHYVLGRLFHHDAIRRFIEIGSHHHLMDISCHRPNPFKEKHRVGNEYLERIRSVIQYQ